MSKELDPPTFADKHALVSAEIARIEGRDLEAMRLYNEAIRAARENGFVQNEGIAHEMAARFYAGRGFDLIAEAYLRKARYCYLRWRATGKVLQLDELYRGSEQRIEAEAMIGEEAIRVDLKKPSAEATSIPQSILRYVARTHESVILDDASIQSPFSDDSYIRQRRARSILCFRSGP